jgi:hypothetical protein
VAFNGEGGVRARPSREEESYGREPHRTALAEQTRHEHAASRNHELFASANHGRPAVAATGRPGEFKGHHVVAAKSAGAPYHAPRVSSKEARAPVAEAKHPASNGSHSANRPSALPSKSNSSHAVIAPRPVSAHPQNQSHVQAAPKAGPAPARTKSAPRAANHENKR